MNLLILGAGGLGREIFSWLSQEIKNKPDHKIIGFLDDNLSGLDNYSYPIKIIGAIKDYQPKEDESLVLAIMEPKIKKQIVESLLKKGAKFYTLIHSSVTLGMNIKFGHGCVVCPNCIISNDIHIGDFVFLNWLSTIGHDTVINHYTSINANVTIAGSVSIDEGCFFGSSATVIPKRKIRKNARIGAGSVVISHIPSETTVFGNPAKKFK